MRDLGFPAGHSAIITGAASGIGRSTALAAAEVGLDVAILDLDEAGLAAVADEVAQLGRKAVTIVADLSDPEQRVLAIDASAAVGDCAYLVNNAGPSSTSALDMAGAMAGTIVAVDAMTNLWLAHPGTSPEAVVNVASTSGNVISGGPWYSAAKAAITGYTRDLAVRRPEGIRANSVGPGLIATPRTAGARAEGSTTADNWLRRCPMGRFGAPEDVAWTILFLLSPLAGFVNGAFVVVDGGSTLVSATK